MYLQARRGTEDSPLQRNPYRCFLSLCLPAYNEELNIAETIRSSIAVLESLAEKFEIIVADDGSDDTTGKLLHDLAATDTRIRLVTHAVNRGYGAAVKMLSSQRVAI